MPCQGLQVPNELRWMEIIIFLGLQQSLEDVDMDTQEMQEASQAWRRKGRVGEWLATAAELQAQTHQSSEIGDVAQDGKAVCFDDGQIEECGKLAEIGV